MSANQTAETALPWSTRLWMTLAAPLIRLIARVVLTIGEPMTVARGDDIDTAAVALGKRLDALTAAADRALDATPATRRSD